MERNPFHKNKIYRFYIHSFCYKTYVSYISLFADVCKNAIYFLNSSILTVQNGKGNLNPYYRFGKNCHEDSKNNPTKNPFKSNPFLKMISWLPVPLAHKSETAEAIVN